MTDKPKAIDPDHYANLDPEPIDVIEAWALSYNCATALSYIARAERKGSHADDLKKAANHLWREATGQWLSQQHDTLRKPGHSDTSLDHPGLASSGWDMHDVEGLLLVVISLLSSAGPYLKKRPTTKIAKARLAINPFLQAPVIFQGLPDYDKCCDVLNSNEKDLPFK